MVETLGVEIGVRTAGSEAAARAADAIADAFRALDLDPRFEEFAFLGYDADEPELEVDGERWPAGPCMYAHPTSDSGVAGAVRRIGSHPSIFGTPLPVFEVVDDASSERARLLTSPFGTGAIPFLSGQGYANTSPSAFVSQADAARLEEGEHRARLRTGGRFVPGRRERNVIADLPGESDEVVVVSAHFDSVWRGPGVVDNATGVEGLLRVAARLRGQAHPRSLRFVAFAAEEIGLMGARVHVAEAKLHGELERVVGVVNLDCIGHGDKLELLASPEELLGRTVALATTMGLADRYELEPGKAGPGTDAYPFALEQVPAVSLLHFPYDEYHLASERLELVDERRVADTVDLAVAVVESQLARPVARRG